MAPSIPSLTPAASRCDPAGRHAHTPPDDDDDDDVTPIGDPDDDDEGDDWDDDDEDDEEPLQAHPRPPRGPGDAEEDELPVGDPPDDDPTDDPDDEDEGEGDDEPLQSLGGLPGCAAPGARCVVGRCGDRKRASSIPATRGSSPTQRPR